MTRIGDSERSLRQQATVTSTAAVLALLVAIVWAAVPPPPAALPAKPTLAAGDPQRQAATVDAAAWQVALWRPFSDAPPPPPKPTPVTIKLFSILRQADGLTAAIDQGAGGGLVYATSGQRVGEYLVTGIDETGIEIEVNGRRQRVELRP
jgi:hypothetical protein